MANGALSTGTIINYTSYGNLRVDITMAIAPDEDIDKAKQVALATLATQEKVLKIPAPDVHVLKVGDGMVTFAIRPFALQPDYWVVFFGAQEAIKKAWDAAGVKGPVPHHVVVLEK